MGELHPKYHTPHRWLLVWYIICIVPLALDFSVSQIADLVMFIIYLRTIVYSLSFLKIPKIFPEQWKKSIFYMPNWAFTLLMGSCAAVAAYQLIVNLMNADPKMIMINIVVLIGALIFSVTRYNSGKVKMQPSWEDA